MMQWARYKTMAIACWHAIRDVVFSRGCAGCDTPDYVLCPQCTRLLSKPTAFALPYSSCGFGLACGLYTHHVRNAILGWKDHDDRECDKPFSQALTQLSAQEPVKAYLDSSTPLILVPAPSSPRSLRKRGRAQLDSIMRHMTRILGEQGYVVQTASLLYVQHVKNKSTSTHSVQERQNRIIGNIAVQESVAQHVPRDALIIVVDDIVTSGATIRECTRVLQAYGFHVLTAWALAYTPVHKAS